MNNYIINNKTIAILKNNNKTIIVDVDNIRVINKNVKYIINQNCMFYGSNYRGRLDYSRVLLSKSYKIPIIINRNIVLIRINNIRNNKCLFIVVNKIKNYSLFKKNILIKCDGSIIFSIKLSKDSFEKLLLNGFKINNAIKIENNHNFV